MNTVASASLRPRLRTLALRLAGLATATCVACPLYAEPAVPSGPDAPALRALLDGRMEEAQSLLHSVLAASPSDAYAHQLLCRVFYAQEQTDPAVHECELAAAADPRSSENFLWLGRAYGLKARHANPLAAFSLARKVHTAFETAVQLNGSSQDALGDLGEYYVEAPGIVGGGEDKARALASRILPQFPSAGHGILASIAESDKNPAAAEQELKLAISTAKGTEAQAQAWIDLGRFYETQHRADDAVNAVKTGVALERSHGPVLVEAAKILTGVSREPALAERCLRDYLAGHNHSDSAPVFKVHLQLARLLAANGDQVAATREIATANALAPDFHGAATGQGM